MKVTPRNMVRAALVFTVAGVIGAVGACKNDNGTNPPPPPPPPPPPAIRAPIGLTATAVSATKINLAWTDSATNETGFRVDRCSGPACTNFAQVGTNLAANTVAFSDSGLTASTSYSYRVRAFNATDSSAWSSTVSATTLAAGASGITLIGAGEITTCSSVGNSATAALVDNQIKADSNTIVFTTGNNIASGSGNTDPSTCFGPTWGKFLTAKGGMHVALGNMDFQSVGGADKVYSYFGNSAGAPTGYYSFNAGSWHIIVLNTTSEQTPGTCGWSTDGAPGGSRCDTVATHPELAWLLQDLNSNTKPCIMAISWERRLYTSTSGTLGRNANLNAVASALYAAGADILVSAKDKQYERFPKLNVDGAPDPKGFAQFIVGTGGRSLDHMNAAASGNPVAAQFGGVTGTPDSWGVMKFTLHDGSYDYEFIPTAPGGFTDKSTTSVACN